MLIDFLIGFFVVNALPHYLFGRMDIGGVELVRMLAFYDFPAGTLRTTYEPPVRASCQSAAIRLWQRRIKALA